ncbi:hypothetical protein [Clostridium phage A2]|mgnify:CR=1 FL=1|uniref:hypothetical protein n=1 Tax=Enterococcus faecium TaxID=1352 RepID=UPI0009476F55|nr:hypothetical protein [Enterococcus faecium]APQ41982.1 hypothetical protein CloPEP1_0037 [Clostridium phage Clo-PEP-1]ASZ76615.1 hypothetical protein [Clostridium phage CP3]AZF89421.1 hypothetical protein CPD4_32 [Clostridium phage CPD4]QGF20112.1 hypothetical protein CPAS15_0061 [Clostridium phage CPAS-15]WAB24114.1 hypothetical protein [Clostridium phage A2]WAB24191.1 hypothetical protein [Clostridium phage C2]WAB24268.1 hypothetical protein [Clostridium phage H1]WAB24345.1 hypothetical
MKVQKFSIPQLRAHCQQLFQVEEFVFNAAVQSLPPDEELTIKQTSQIIKDWLKKEVK